MAHHYNTISSSAASINVFRTLCIFLAAMMAFHAHAQAQPDMTEGSADDQSESLVLGPALREVLMATRGGLGANDMETLLSRYALMTHVLGMGPSAPRGLTQKRAGWKRIPVQTRFAPFGTKLVPSRHRGESNGPTLLRYGRSI